MTTTAIALVKEMAEPVKHPRALAVPFPYGYALGKPEDPAYQHQVLAAALGLLERNDTPVMAELSDDPGRPVQLLQSHTSIGFDHTAFYRDVNICFPMDRLRELVDRRVIGSLSASYYSYMGAQRDPRRIVDETGPEVARLLRAEGVDVVLLTPT